MSSKILLEDDDDNDDMFNDEEEEEEEEDVDLPVAAPVKAEPTVDGVAAVKEEEMPSADKPVEDEAAEGGVDINGEKVEEKSEEENGVSDSADAPTATTTAIPTPTTLPPSSSSSSNNLSPLLLPTSLPSMSPSPFPHHNTGPTSDRLRNAMQRIAANPARDAEAWQALITEAQSCWRSLGGGLRKLKNIPSAVKEEGNEAEAELLERKLDWIEACYGALLHYFPYAVTHYVQLAEMLLRLSALTQDEEEQCGPVNAGLMGMMGAQQGVQGSALSNPAMTTLDQGVAISPAGLLMTPVMASSGTERQRLIDEKLDRIFQLCLGVTLDGSPALHGDIAVSSSIDAERATSLEGARTVTGGLAPHSADLWLLYLRKRYWDAARAAATAVMIPLPPPGYMPLAQQMSVLHQQYEEGLRSAYRERKEKTREGISAAYESALERGAGFAQNNHLIWKRYVNYVKSWTVPVNYAGAAMSLLAWMSPGTPDPNATLPPADPAHDHSTTQKQLGLLRSVYQRGVTHPMTGLDQFWQEYENFERSHSESLGSVLIAEWLPRYQHARSIYLERNRVWTVHELKVAGRLAVPPVGCESAAAAAGMGLTSRAGAVGATDDDFGGEGAGTGASGMTGKPASEAELIAQLDEERLILSKWRRRSAYERTNPERLSASDHAMKVRAAYREQVCAFARHPEVWYEWSSWELLHGASSAAATTATPTTTNPGSAGGQGGSASSTALIAPAQAGDWKSGGNGIRAVAVLSLGMESLPDSALLAQAQAEVLERHVGGGESAGGKGSKGDVASVGCIKVLERFVDRAPTTLGFVLLQRLVRRHQGIASARAVFARARRTLKVREEDMRVGDEDGKDPSAVAAEKTEDVAGQVAEVKEMADTSGNGAAATQHHMVTNRLKSSLGSNAPQLAEAGTSQTATANAGYITWHLYAAHATVEHRLSKNPKVAARIYELGLRKHRSFLSNPPYVLHYANLLLELNDEENLRSLLMRAVAACEEEEAAATATGGAASGGSSDAAATARRREMQRPLWDMMLKFESILSSQSSNGNVSADISSIEARRRRALYGPSNEDVVMGGEGPPDDDEDRNLGTGLHKSSLNEQLVRVEGYDVASRIANGMGRMVDVLTVTGAIGNGAGELDATSSLDFASAASASMTAGGASSDVWGDECAGGPSDVSYVKRLKFQRESRTRAAASALGLSGGANQGGAGAGKLLTRERSNIGGAAGQAAANALAIQNAPEWLRPLLLLLPPVPKFGRASTVKPPPHLTEMALSTLRGSQLPVARPVSNGSSAGNSRKRGRNNGGDSSDEENGNTPGGGYSNQFRSRQRSRLTNATSS